MIGVEDGESQQPKAKAGQTEQSLLSLRDLLSLPETAHQWLVSELLIRGGISVLVGKPKVGKSTFARNLALALANGRPFLGRATLPSRVLYLALEELDWQVARHFRQMHASGGEEIWVRCGPQPGGLARLKRDIELLEPDLVIVDPLFRFVHCADACDYIGVLNALGPLFALARQSRAHVLLVHHATKARKDGADQILGSTAIFGTVDAAMVLERVEGVRHFSSFQRYGIGFEPTILSFDEETRLFELAGSVEAQMLEETADTIGRVLADAELGLTEAEITERVTGRTGAIRRALRSMVESGRLEKLGSGVRGDPFRYASSKMS